MQRSIAIVLLSVLLSVAASWLVVRSFSPAPARSAAAMPSALPGPGGKADVSEELRSLRRSLEELSMEVATLRDRSSNVRRSPLEEAVSGGGANGAGSELVNAKPRDDGGADRRAGASSAKELELFRARVADVLAEIEEERAAEKRDAELEGRRDEALKANIEYETFDRELQNRLAAMQEKLYLNGDQVEGLQSLLLVQNDRHREMTRLWSEGQTDEKELGRLFVEYRKSHRSEVGALLNRDQLGAYRKYLREGGLGPRFSYFVAPGEAWGDDADK